MKLSPLIVKIMPYKASNMARFFRLLSNMPTEKPPRLDGGHIETTPDVTLGILR